jgi:hypothetical protein
MAFTQDRLDGEEYEDTAHRLLADVERRLDPQNPSEAIALASAWALLAIRERLAAVEFQLSQMPRD